MHSDAVPEMSLHCSGEVVVVLGGGAAIGGSALAVGFVVLEWKPLLCRRVGKEDPMVLLALSSMIGRKGSNVGWLGGVG